MSLLERLDADLKKAMRAKDTVTRDTIRMVKSEISLTEKPDLLAILARGVKSRRDSIAAYEEGSRMDLADKERAEIAVIERYLPEQLSEDESRAIITKLAADEGISSKKEMGRLMKLVMAEHRGQIDGKLASRLASELLS